MSKYEEFKNRKITTVSQLIEKLKKLPQNATLQSEGGDIGGYDVCTADYLDINYHEQTNKVSFSHMEYEMYEAYENKLITYEQLEELNDEK